MERRSERIFGQRYGCRPVKIADLNLHLMCVLCSGYYIDATTIIECLHSFCRSCIVRYLETCGRCPICDVLVHKAQPLLNIRLDHVLQGLVYKLVPGLLTKEMNSRREFYTQGLMSRRRDQSEQEDTMKTLQSVSISEEAQQTFIKTPNLTPADSESLSISLEYLPNSKVSESRASAQDAESRVSDSTTDMMDLSLNEYADIRYLLCPAGFTVRGLTKFIRAKFDLPLVYQIDIFHGDECLESHFSMLDVAFIFQWQKRAPLHLRYSVGYVPRAKRKLTSSNSARRQNSKENETLQGEPNKISDEKRTFGQHVPTKSHSSISPSKTSKHANARTRPIEDHRKSTFCRNNGSTRSKLAGCRIIQNETSSMSSGGSGSGNRDGEGGGQHVDMPKENLKTSGKEEEGILFGIISKGKTVSKDSDKRREISDERISEFQEYCGKRMRDETGGQNQTSNMSQIDQLNCGASERAELTIDLTGEDPICSVATLSSGEVNNTSGTCPESASRVVGSITFVGNGSATVLSRHESILCSIGQNSVNSDVAKSSITHPCVNAFKTLSSELHGRHLGYPSDTGQIGVESMTTDNVMKIIPTPEVTIVPSFGVQLIYSPDSIMSQNPICGVIQLPDPAPISATSDALAITPTWSHGDVPTNGIMNDTDFLRLYEGSSICTEKSFRGCFEHFVMPNLVEGVGNKMSEEASLGYSMSLDPTTSGPLPCVFMAQETGHQAQNSWSLLGSSKDAEMVDWGLCYPVTAAELGSLSLAGFSDNTCTELQPECSFVCVTSNALPGSTAKADVGGPWLQGPYADRNGMVEVAQTMLGARGEPWPVESRQCEPRAVKMCIVEPQAVKRKAEDERAVEPKEAKTSYAVSNTAKTQQTKQRTAEENIAVEPQPVEAQVMGLPTVESMPEPFAVEARTVEPTDEPSTMGSRAVEQGSRETVKVGLQSMETKTASSCMVECSPEETHGAECKPQKSMLSKLDPLEEPYPVEPKAGTSGTVELQAARQSQTVDSYPAEVSLMEPDDVELTVEAQTSPLEQLTSEKRRGTGVNCRTAEDPTYNVCKISRICPNSLPIVDRSSLTSVSVDSGSPHEAAGTGQNQEETSVLLQNRHAAVGVNSANNIVGYAIPKNSKEQLFELLSEEKFLFSGDNLAKFHDMSTDWGGSNEEKQLTSAVVNKDSASESMDGSKAVIPKTENSELSLVDEGLSLITKPESISYKVEEISASPEDERLVVNTMEQMPVSAKAEDVLAPSNDVTDVEVSVDPLNDHLSNRTLSSPGSEAMPCSSKTTMLSISAAEHISVSSVAINRCPVSDAILVSDACGKTIPSDDCSKTIASDDCSKATASDDCSKTIASDDCSKTIASDDCSKTIASDVCSKRTASDDCSKTIASDDCSKTIASDDCSKTIASDDCRKVPSSDDCSKTIASDDCSKTIASDDCRKVPSSDDCSKTIASDDCSKTIASDDCRKVPSSDDCSKTIASDDCSKTIASDDCRKVPSSDDCSKTIASDDCSKTIASDDCRKVPSSDDCSKTIASDDCSKTIASDDCRKVPSSDDCSKTIASDDCSKTIASDDCSKTIASDDCRKVPSSDDCSKTIASDDCSKTIASDDCRKVPSSDDCSKTIASDDCSETIASDDCSKTIASDDCRKVPSSDDCSKTIASDDCRKVPSSDDCSKATASDDCGKEPISDSCNKRPVSTVDTRVWLSDEGMFVSVTDDHVMVYVGDEEPSSGAEASNSDEAMQIGIAAKEMPVLDDDSGILVLKSGTHSCKGTLVSDTCNGILDSDGCYKMTVSDDCNESSISDSCYAITASYDFSEIPISDACNKILPSSDDGIMVPISDPCNETVTTDDCNNLPIPDSCNNITTSDDCSDVPVLDSHDKIPVADVCDEVRLSITPLNLPISAVTGQTAISNAEQADPCMFMDLHVQNPLVFDKTQVRITRGEDLLSSISNDLPVSNVPEKIPACVLIDECELTNSSVSELSICVPIPAVPNSLPIDRVVTEDIPVSPTSSLENLPVCSSSLETASFCTSMSVEIDFCQPLAVSRLAGGCSNRVAQHVAIEHRAMSVSEELEEKVLSCYISSCDLDISEVVLVTHENSNSALSDINLGDVEITWKDGITEDRNAEQLDFADRIETNSIDESLVTDKDVVSSSVPMECDDGKSTENLVEDRVPGGESKTIDSLVDTVPDQKSVESMVNLLPSGDSVATRVEEREENEDEEEGDSTSSHRLLCSGSSIREDEECHFRSIASVPCSFSFSNTSSRSLDCAISSDSHRWRSRSLDESTDSVELQSSGVQLIDRVLLKENTALLNRRQDTVNVSRASDVVGVGDERADTCKSVVPDMPSFCDTSCYNLTSNGGVSE